MALDQGIAAALAAMADAGLPPMTSMTPQQVRGMERRLDLSGNPALAPVGSVADISFDGPAGPLAARVYRPAEGPGGPGASGGPGGPVGWPDGARPTLLWFHGGGWVIGSIDSHDLVARLLAGRTGAVVVSAAYRLAPEDPFPAAVDDAVAVARETLARAGELGGDPGLVAVGGDSAGGNLAAVVAQQLRGTTPGIAAQLLAYPSTDLAGSAENRFASQRENADGPVLTAADGEWFARHYAGDRTPEQLTDPRLSPLRAGELSGLPPAVVATAQYDPLRDEGVAYADALAAAGVRVRARTFAGLPHGYLNWTQASPAALAALDRSADDLVELLRG